MSETNSTTSSESIADSLKAISHPSRLQILYQLAQRDRCCGADFCDCLNLAQSTVSQHLDLLKEAGLVDWQQQGTRSIYTLNRERISQLADALHDLAQRNCCSDPRKDS